MLMALPKSLLVCMLLCTALATDPVCAEDHIDDTEDRLPGWHGEQPQATLQAAYHDSVGYGELGQEVWRGRVEQLSWEPRAFLFHNFLSDEECDHLRDLAESQLVKSQVVDSSTGKSVDSTVRTSSGMFLQTHQDEVVSRIEKRLSHITMIPEENGESLQILKYVNGQKYEAHHDYFHDSVNSAPEKGGQRVATVLMYLTTPEEGGETVFPNADHKVKGEGWSECALGGLAVKSVKGNALLFYGLKPDGTEDPKSLHGSCPTTKGVKYSATKWIHVGAFNTAAGGDKAGAAGGCRDENPNCEKWAVAGECENNPAYMGVSCKKACKKCTVNPRRAAAQRVRQARQAQQATQDGVRTQEAQEAPKKGWSLFGNKEKK